MYYISLRTAHASSILGSPRVPTQQHFHISIRGREGGREGGEGRGASDVWEEGRGRSGVVRVAPVVRYSKRQAGRQAGRQAPSRQIRCSDRVGGEWEEQTRSTIRQRNNHFMSSDYEEKE